MRLASGVVACYIDTTCACICMVLPMGLLELLRGWAQDLAALQAPDKFWKSSVNAVMCAGGQMGSNGAD
jgi:hypothetical protein